MSMAAAPTLKLAYNSANTDAETTGCIPCNSGKIEIHQMRLVPTTNEDGTKGVEPKKDRVSCWGRFWSCCYRRSQSERREENREANAIVLDQAIEIYGKAITHVAMMQAQIDLAKRKEEGKPIRPAEKAVMDAHGQEMLKVYQAAGFHKASSERNKERRQSLEPSSSDNARGGRAPHTEHRDGSESPSPDMRKRKNSAISEGDVSVQTQEISSPSANRRTESKSESVTTPRMLVPPLSPRRRADSTSEPATTPRKLLHPPSPVIISPSTDSLSNEEQRVSPSDVRLAQSVTFNVDDNMEPSPDPSTSNSNSVGRGSDGRAPDEPTTQLPPQGYPIPKSPLGSIDWKTSSDSETFDPIEIPSNWNFHVIDIDNNPRWFKKDRFLRVLETLHCNKEWTEELLNGVCNEVVKHMYFHERRKLRKFDGTADAPIPMLELEKLTLDKMQKIYHMELIPASSNVVKKVYAKKKEELTDEEAVDLCSTALASSLKRNLATSLEQRV